MNIASLSATTTLVAGLSLALLSNAFAMPIGGAPSASAASVQPVEWSPHRIYPGSDSKEAQKARDARNAPNRECEKQTQYCE